MAADAECKSLGFISDGECTVAVFLTSHFEHQKEIPQMTPLMQRQADANTVSSRQISCSHSSEHF